MISEVKMGKEKVCSKKGHERKHVRGCASLCYLAHRQARSGSPKTRKQLVTARFRLKGAELGEKEKAGARTGGPQGLDT